MVNFVLPEASLASGGSDSFNPRLNLRFILLKFLFTPCINPRHNICHKDNPYQDKCCCPCLSMPVFIRGDSINIQLHRWACYWLVRSPVHIRITKSSKQQWCCFSPDPCNSKHYACYDT